MELLNVELEQPTILQTVIESGSGQFPPEAADLLKEILYMNEYSTPELAAEAKEKIDELIEILKNVTVIGISVTYTGGSVKEGTSVDDLEGIVVTASYSDGTSKTVEGYTMTPDTIVVGTNTITVSFGGQTDTFTVTGLAKEVTSISAVYSGDSVVEGTSTEDLREDITVTATYEDSTTAVVTEYTLSPSTIVVGSNVIAISFGGKNTSITVTGTAAPKPNLLLTTAVRTEEGYTYATNNDQIRLSTSSSFGTLYIVPVKAGKTYKYSLTLSGQYTNPYINNYQFKSCANLSPTGTPATSAGGNAKTYLMGSFEGDPDDILVGSYSTHFTMYEVNSTSAASTVKDGSVWILSMEITYTHDGYAIFAHASNNSSNPVLIEV